MSVEGKVLPIIGFIPASQEGLIRPSVTYGSDRNGTTLFSSFPVHGWCVQVFGRGIGLSSVLG